MLTETEARDRILAAISPLAQETVPLLASLGRYAAQPVIATLALPGFDNSQMDGYAVRAAEAGQGAELQVAAEQPAGLDREQHLAPGQAIRIFTGAAIPDGCDAVVMQEDVSRTGNTITVLEAVAVGEYIRRRGSDLCEGQIILHPGQLLSPALIGVLASQGLATVAVHRQPRVAILGTGDEIIPPGTPLLPGQIYNSNGPMLAALLAQHGITHVSLHHCRDDLPSTTETLRQLVETHDVILISGGVSVGDHDHVKPALQALGIAPNLWRVKVKPGKPFLFAQQAGVHLFGLPGNPVSAFVTYHLFVQAALLKLMGQPNATAQTFTAQAGSPLTNDGDRPHYLRGKLERGIFQPTGLQQSHALHGLSQCNALARVPENTTLQAGDACEVRLL